MRALSCGELLGPKHGLLLGLHIAWVIPGPRCSLLSVVGNHHWIIRVLHAHVHVRRRMRLKRHGKVKQERHETVKQSKR